MIVRAKPSAKIINLKDHPEYQNYQDAFDNTWTPAKYLAEMFDKNVEAVRYQKSFLVNSNYCLVRIDRLVRVDFVPTKSQAEIELNIFVRGDAFYARKIRSGETLDLPILRSTENNVDTCDITYIIKNEDVKYPPLATLIEYAKSERNYEKCSLEDYGFKKVER